MLMTTAFRVPCALAALSLAAILGLRGIGSPGEPPGDGVLRDTPHGQVEGDRATPPDAAPADPEVEGLDLDALCLPCDGFPEEELCGGDGLEDDFRGGETSDPGRWYWPPLPDVTP